MTFVAWDEFEVFERGLTCVARGAEKFQEPQFGLKNTGHPQRNTNREHAVSPLGYAENAKAIAQL